MVGPGFHCRKRNQDENLEQIQEVWVEGSTKWKNNKPFQAHSDHECLGCKDGEMLSLQGRQAYSHHVKIPLSNNCFLSFIQQWYMF